MERTNMPEATPGNGQGNHPPGRLIAVPVFVFAHIGLFGAAVQLNLWGALLSTALLLASLLFLVRANACPQAAVARRGLFTRIGAIYHSLVRLPDGGAEPRPCCPGASGDPC